MTRRAKAKESMDKHYDELFKDAPEVKAFLLEKLPAEINAMSSQDILRRRKDLKEAANKNILHAFTPYMFKFDTLHKDFDGYARQARHILQEYRRTNPQGNSLQASEFVEQLLEQVETFKKGRLRVAYEAQDWLHTTNRNGHTPRSEDLWVLLLPAAATCCCCCCYFTQRGADRDTRPRDGAVHEGVDERWFMDFPRREV